jgi:hypothetical protein
MSEARERVRATAPERADRVFTVAAIAAAAAAVWCVCVFGPAAVPLALLATPASALLWLAIASQLEQCERASRRLAAAIAWGLVSPVLGIGLAVLPTMCCANPCVPGFAGALMFADLWNEPWLYEPVGVAMGLVAFLVVSVHRPTRPS